MQDVKIKVDFENNILGKIAAQYNVSIKILRCGGANQGGGVSLIRVETHEKILCSDVAGWFKGLDQSISPTCMTIAPGRHLLILRNPHCTLCDSFSFTKCVLSSGRSEESGSIIWNVITPDPDSFRAFIKDVRSKGAMIELQKIRRHQPKTELTNEQDRILRDAYRLGYFEVPRRITLDDLAKMNKVSKSTINLIIRRAQRKVINSYCNVE
jgi:HTH-type transcriptional regulator, dimethyl sulfoxide reductase transcription regulator